MNFILNPSKVIQSDRSALIVIDEHQRCEVAWQNLGLSRERFAAITRGAVPATDELPVLCNLLKQGVLINDEPGVSDDQITSRSFGYFASKTSTPRRAQQQVADSRVAVLGVGGTGTIVLQHLVAAGIKDYLLIDSDRIETSNMNRQFMWATRNVGELKVNVARRYIEERVEDAMVRTKSQFIHDRRTAADILNDGFDLLFVCIDGPTGIEAIVVDEATRLGISVMTGAVGIDRGHVGPLFPARRRFCELCWYPPSSRETTAPRWSNSTTNSLVANLMARDGIAWLSGWSASTCEKRITIDFPTLRTWTSQVPKHGCQHECSV